MPDRHMFDLFSEADFNAAREAKLITIREDGEGLRILNYSDAAMYTPGAWTSRAVRTCRGLIVDSAGFVIARPWAKFFNHGQAEAGDLDLSAPVEVTDKMDGSLGIIHRALDGRLRVASRGSFESDQAVHATAWLEDRDWVLYDVDYYTPLVEIIYPANRIVCDYGDQDELVLLGAVHIATGDYLGPTDAATVTRWPGARAETFDYTTLRDALAAEPRPGKEGLCVRYLDEPRIVKIKQEEYVRLHKIVTGLSERSVWEHMSNGEPLTSLLAELPDELHDWTREVWAGIEREVLRIALAAESVHLSINAADRKSYAAEAMKHPELRPYLFNLLDGKDPRPSILRTLKPAGDTRARAFSEAVA